MKAREFHPRQLDVRAFVETGESLGGTESLSPFERLLSLCPAEAEAPQAVAAPRPVRWSARGELRPRPGGAPEVWLHLQGETTLPLQCQRCLDAVEVPLAFDRWFLFVDSERLAAELDADSDDDVLVTSRQFDLLSLVEDELLMVAPIVPRHEVCPAPVQLATPDWHAAAPATDGTDATDEAAAPHPFAALAALRKGSA